jgi:Uma2 family endonuclease
MATLSIEPPVALRPRRETVAGRRFRFTPDEYQRLGETGILHEDDRVELIDGEIIEMSPIGIQHSECVAIVNIVLHELLGRTAKVYPQNSIRLLNTSEPEPDFAVIRFKRYRTLPTERDVYLVMEVSDSSLRYDRTVKLPLYAAAGIPEAWIFDIGYERIERHTDPTSNGYATVQAAGRGDMLASTVLPAVRVSVDEVFGPEEGPGAEES